MLSVINEPPVIFPLWTDYYFQYNSTINNVINFKYFIEYQELVNSIWTTIDQFARFPNPDGTTTFNLRKYLSSKIESDYFYSNYYIIDGLYPNPLEKDFRLKISEEYAYQFPYGVFDSTGAQIGTGVSANSVKWYGIYNLKLTYTSPLNTFTPIFSVGSVIQIIDNSNPITNSSNINGIYTVLEVGTNYIVINGIFNSTITYFSGSVLWSDHRQVINSTTTYTSSVFNSMNSCNEDNSYMYTSIPNNYTLRVGDFLLIPIIKMKTINIYDGVNNLLFTRSPSTVGNYLLNYTLPSYPTTIKIDILDINNTIVETKNIIISNYCNPRFDRVTLYFLDRKGGFIPYYFDLCNTLSLSVSNNNYKALDINGRSNKYQIDTQVNEKYKLTTDWLNKDQAKLFNELFESSYLWMFYETNGTPQKVLIIDKQLETKRFETTRLLNYTLTVELSKEKYIQQ